MRGVSLRVYLSVLLFIVLKLRCATPSGADLSFYDWCINKHGEFFAHPLECSKFIRCSHDRAYVFQCPTTLRWNQTIKTCDWEQKTKCLLDGVTDIDAGIGDIKKKSVKRDTSRHTEIYQSSPKPTTFSSTADFLTASKGFGSHTLKEVSDTSKSTTQVLENIKVSEYSINSKTIDDVLLTTLKSILKTPCTKNFHIKDVKSTSANTITEYVKITDNETSTEADNLEDTMIKNTTISNDAITELSSGGPNEKLFATGLLLSSANDSMDNEDESLSLTESPFGKSLQGDTPTTETHTNNTDTVLLTQEPYENIITSELPDISSEFHSEISKRTSLVPIAVLEEISTGTTIPESTTVGEHDETGLTGNQNNNEWKFTELPNEIFNTEFRPTKSDVLLVKDINVELTEGANTESVLTSVVTEAWTERDLGTTAYTTGNGNTMFTDSVVVTEQSVTDINVVLPEDGNNTETAKENGNTMLTESVAVTEQNVNGINLVLTKYSNTEVVLSSVVTETRTETDLGTTESTTENGNTMVTDLVVMAEQNVTDINMELREDGSTEFVFTSVVPEPQTQLGLGTTESTTENGNTMVTDSVVVAEQNETDVNLELIEDGNIEFVFTSVVPEPQTQHGLGTTESTTENGNTMVTDSIVVAEQNETDVNLELIEDGNIEFVFTSVVPEPQTEHSLGTTETVRENDNTMLTESVAVSKQNVTDINVVLTEGDNTELIFTMAVTETQNKHYLGTTESHNSVEITEHADNLTELPPNVTKIADDSSETPREITIEDMETLTTERLDTEVLTELYTDTPDDLTEALTNLEIETISPSSENLKESSTFAITANTIYSDKLTDLILNANSLTSLAAQETENPELLTETSRDVAEVLTESSTNVMTIINDYITEPTKNTTLITERLDGANIITNLTGSLHDEYITLNSVKLTDVTIQENVMTNFSEDEEEIMELMNNISTEVNTELTETLTEDKIITRVFDTESKTYTETPTDKGVVTTFADSDVTDALETQDDFTETVIIYSNLTETAAANFDDIENTMLENLVTENYILSVTTYKQSDQEATEDGDFKDHGLAISVTNKFDISTSTTDDPVTDKSVTGTMLNLNSDAYIMFSTTTVVPSTVITDSVTFTETLFEEMVDFSQKQKDNEFNSDPFQERLLEGAPTASASSLSLIKNQMSSDEEVNNNLISTSVLTSTALDPTFDGGALSNEILDISTTADPRLPFRSPKCKGDNNNRQFKASKCSQYYQCFAGWAFLLNCYEGYLFVTQEATCIQDIKRECNE